jgi:hypothetical protein
MQTQPNLTLSKPALSQQGLYSDAPVCCFQLSGVPAMFRGLGASGWSRGKDGCNRARKTISEARSNTQSWNIEFRIGISIALFFGSKPKMGPIRFPFYIPLLHLRKTRLICSLWSC